MDFAVCNLRELTPDPQCHGTGTPVGDPIEVDAVSRVFRHKRGQRTRIGSVKTNLGHSEAASGLSSVIKVALAFEEQIIPPTIGIKSVNPALHANNRRIDIVTKPTLWGTAGSHRASVNSFGFGGANSHVILESAVGKLSSDCNEEQDGKTEIARDEDEDFLLPLSASKQTSLQRRIDALASFNDQHDLARDLPDLAFTLGCRRSHMDYRTFIICSQKTLPAELDWKKGSTFAKVAPLPLAFIFNGQGSQWPGQGSELIHRFQNYSDTIARLDGNLTKIPGGPDWTIRGLLTDTNLKSQIHEATKSQTICTATQIALVNLMSSWGIVPTASLGHSSGEISAAYTAGHVSESEAISLAYHRGALASRVPTAGTMLAVGLGKEEAEAKLPLLSRKTQVRLACDNSPESVTLSGNSDKISFIKASLQEQHVFVRELTTDGRAYHSDHMLFIGERYERLLSDVLREQSEGQSFLEQRTIGTQMFSSTTGAPANREICRDPSHWRKNLENRVEFNLAFQSLANQDLHVIEVGSHPTLQMPIRQIQKTFGQSEDVGPYTSTLERNKHSVTQMFRLAGTLFANGHEITFRALNVSGAKLKVLSNLPPYPWYYEKLLWNESRFSKEFKDRQNPRHDLLGSLLPGGNGVTKLWRNVLSTREVSWISDHNFADSVIFPAAGFLSMIYEAMRQTSGLPMQAFPGLRFRQVKLFKALTFSEKEYSAELFTEMKPVQISGTTSSRYWWTFSISSFANQSASPHASGYASFEIPLKASEPRVDFDLDRMHQRDASIWYSKLTERGVKLGPAFRVLENIHTDRQRHLCQAGASMTLSQGEMDVGPGATQYGFHPTVIDGMLQTSLLATTAGNLENLHAKMPVSIEEMWIGPAPEKFGQKRVYMRSISEQVGFGAVINNAEIVDEQDRVLVKLLKARAIPYQGTQEASKRMRYSRYPNFRVSWKPCLARLLEENQHSFGNYINEFAAAWAEDLSLETRGMAGALDLVLHEQCNLRILDLSLCTEQGSNAFQRVARYGTNLQRFELYLHGSISKDDHQLQIHDTEDLDAGVPPSGSEGKELDGNLFDLAIVPSVCVACEMSFDKFGAY